MPLLGNILAFLPLVFDPPLLGPAVGDATAGGQLGEAPGLIQPFLKEHGYQFPVVLAYNFFSAQLEEGIPQNWIVDSNGNWQWTQTGMGTSDQWEEMILSKLEGANTPE